MIRAMVAAVFGLSSIAAGALAQTVGIPAVTPGQRVRLTIAGARGKHWQKGTVGRVSGDTLWLDTDGKTQAVPVPAIERLERSNGTRSNFLPGLGIGVLTGVTVGGLIGLTSGDDPPCRSDTWICWRNSASENAGLAAAGFGVLGAIIGGVAGSATRSERWIQASPADLRLSVGTRGGVAIDLSYRF